MVLAFALSAGCAMGGASDDLGSGRDDAEDLPPDDAEEDLGIDETSTSDETAPLEDSGALEDSGGPEPDVAPDVIFPVEDTGCTPSCSTCGAADGCGGTCKTGACGGGATCVAGKCVSPTRSHLSPGDYAFGTAWARGITWTIGSEEPATIRYTLDGSAPGPSSPSKPSPADLFVATSGTTIKWYADNGAKEPTTHSFVANILASGQTSYGFIVEKVNLSGKGPVVVASPGATITGNASYAAWTSTGCPGCRMQLVYGVGSTSAGCLYDWSPGNWPGAAASGSISVKAPGTPGTYTLNVSYTLEYSCAGGMATNPLNVRATAGVATIVVR